jgi:hypothetical protein
MTNEEGSGNDMEENDIDLIRGFMPILPGGIEE